MASPVGPNITVDIELGTGAPILAADGRTLIVEQVGAVISDQDEQVFKRTARAYSSSNAVTSADEESAVDAAADTYFGSPFNVQPMIVGSQMMVDQPHIYYGSAVTLADIEALGNAYTGLSFAGNELDIDLDGVSTGAGQATAIQDEITSITGFSSATVGI